MKIIHVLSLLFFISYSTLAQKMNTSYITRWNSVESAMQKGLNSTAEKEVLAILQTAKTEGNAEQTIKAICYYRITLRDRDEQSRWHDIQYVEKELKVANFPTKPLLQSLLADLYWSYYQENRWKILDRTPVAEDQAKPTKEQVDVETWTVNQFYNKAAELYLASISNEEELQKYPLKNFKELVSAGKNTSKLRSTLYDLLVHEAIQFFQQEDIDLTKPAYSFEIADDKAFAPAAQFVQTKFTTQDTSDQKWHVLQLFQHLLSFHLHDEDPSALIDADIFRIKYVKQFSVSAEKELAYSNALKQLTEKYPTNSQTATAWYLLGETHLHEDFELFQEDDHEGHDENNFKEALAIFNKIINTYPTSEGAYLAEVRKQSILQHSLSVITEKTVLPNKASLARIGFKNIHTLYCKIVKLNLAEYKEANIDFYQTHQRYFNKPSLQNWSVTLPLTDDYKTHATEIKVPPVPLGHYALIVSESANWADDAYTAFSLFNASNISFVTQASEEDNNLNVFVIHRESGKPLNQVKVKLWRQEYDYQQRKSNYKEGSSFTTDINGLFKMNLSDDQNNSWNAEFAQGDDVYYSQDPLYKNRYYKQTNDNVRTFFFTDRSMYRPGQTIYFKGILIKSLAGDISKHELQKNKDVFVTLSNANGEVVKEMYLKTNEFGSYAGSVQAPEGLLNGQFTLAGEGGQVTIHVEEYKRPKFEVSFDTLKGSYRLNEKVKLKGIAKAYAGNQIDGAQVKYRVYRTAMFPYSWCFYRWGQPSSPEMEIQHGSAVTKLDGSFDIEFTALPDLNIEKKTMPVFHYRVEADITDLNGETRHGNMNVPVSYQALQLSLNLPTQADFNDFNSIEVRSTNLQGTHLSSQVTLTCKKLKSIEGTYRERLWPKVDKPSISLQDFRKDFPLDVYQDENNYLTWNVEKIVWTKTITTKENGVEYLQKIANDDGWYVIEAKATDQYGEEVIDKKYIRLSTYTNPVVLPNEHLLVTEIQTKAEPGNKASFSLSTAYDQINLLYQVNRGTSKTEWISLGKKLIDFDIHEEDRGGFQVEGVFVKNNRVYCFNQFILVAWTNKELTITTETFRDKMLPGSEQEWILTIKGDKKEKVSAELLTSMYDASLDAFQSHRFNKPELFNLKNQHLGFVTHYCFQSHQGMTVGNPPYITIEPYEKNYATLQSFGLLNDYGGGYNRRGLERGMVTEALMMDAAAAPMAKMTKSVASSREESDDIKFMPPDGARKDKAMASPKGGNEDMSSGPRKNIEVRSNFAETAFFFPQLNTDAEGNIRFKFKAPDALTKWKMMSFAHTQDLKMGLLESFSVTQKQLMIVPQTPRFLREGDLMEYSAKVTNLSDKKLHVKASVEFMDAFTLDNRNLVFNNTKPNVDVDIPIGESRPITWTIRIPEGFTNPVLIKTLADAGEYTDGEQNVVPVLLNSMLVTETMPLPVRANTEKSFRFDKLINSFQSSTLRQHSLTVEYTGNPAWYAIQVLPYLTDYPYECAEQTFNRYYANVLATHMANAYPKVKEIFSAWKNQDTAALLSNLEKNQELKSALLQETPWVLEAKSESAQKQELANLFNLTRMSKELERTVRELEIMQTPNGGFAWFKGMPDDRFMTQYILTGLGRLLHLGVSEVGSERRIMQIIDKAIPYVDARLKEDYQALIKYKADLKKQQISYTQIQYLYMRSFFAKRPVSTGAQVAFDFYKKQAGQFWVSQNKYMQGMSALALFRFADIPKAEAILKSLRENAIRNDEMGMYWKDMNSSYWWYEAPIEAQSLLIEAFQEIGGKDDEVDELKIWLLKSKQTQNWKTTKATADACYALLLKGNEWLVQSPEVEIQLGKELIQSKNIKTEAGTGYFKKSYNADQVKPDMGEIRVKISADAKGTSWGAVYWQYFENLDKITYAATPLSLRKDLYLIKNSDKGPVLDKIKDESVVKVGDQIKVRIELRVDRDMEYVHLKDMRGACFEPINVISQYKYQGGLGYYESTKDANTSFFFHWLPKGTYVFEYPMTVTNKGDYSNGIATIQCMYAPEFSSHSAGVRVKVK